MQLCGFSEFSWSCVMSRTWTLQDEENTGLAEEEEEEAEEPIFVLTDEWREFFAASEAKRKLG